MISTKNIYMMIDEPMECYRILYDIYNENDVIGSVETNIYIATRTAFNTAIDDGFKIQCALAKQDETIWRKTFKVVRIEHREHLTHKHKGQLFQRFVHIKKRASI